MAKGWAWVAMLLAASTLLWWRGGLTGRVVQDVVEDDGSIEVLFSRTADARAAMLSRLSAASDIECAIYDVEDPAVAAALERAALITDTDSHVRGDVEDDGSGLMHNKFCVLDGEAVWTGSLNPTLNGLDRNDNNIVILHSRVLARNYHDEFEELWRQAHGTKGSRPVRAPWVRLGGVLVENYFCPEDRCETQVLRALRAANRSIRFMVYSFTSDPLGEMLLGKSAAGLEVRGVFERRGLNDYSEYHPLSKAGLDVVLDGNPSAMHHKVFIVDEAVVVTGSYNPSASGDGRNDENLLIIHNAGIAAQFLQEFARVWGQAQQ